jgi:hypothetical protein
VRVGAKGSWERDMRGGRKSSSDESGERRDVISGTGGEDDDEGLVLLRISLSRVVTVDVVSLASTIISPIPASKLKVEKFSYDIYGWCRKHVVM